MMHKKISIKREAEVYEEQLRQEELLFAEDVAEASQERKERVKALDKLNKSIIDDFDSDQQAGEGQEEFSGNQGVSSAELEKTPGVGKHVPEFWRKKRPRPPPRPPLFGPRPSLICCYTHQKT